MKKEMNNRNTSKNYIPILMIILLLALVFMPTVQAKDENKGFVYFKDTERIKIPDIPHLIKFTNDLTFEIEYKPEITIPNSTILPNETKNIEITLKDKEASLKLRTPAISILDIKGIPPLKLPSKELTQKFKILREKDISIPVADDVGVSITTKLVINSSVSGNIVMDKHKTRQVEKTQLEWQKSESKKAEINSRDCSAEDSIDIYLVNPKYQLSFEFVIFIKFLGKTLFSKKILQQQVIEIAGQSYNVRGNLQVVSWPAYYHIGYIIIGVIAIPIVAIPAVRRFRRFL